MINLELDPQGRLTILPGDPARRRKVDGQSAGVRLELLFAAAGPDAAKFQKAEPQWNSLAVRCAMPHGLERRPGTTRPLRVEAALWQGKPVFFSPLETGLNPTA